MSTMSNEDPWIYNQKPQADDPLIGRSDRAYVGRRSSYQFRRRTSSTPEYAIEDSPHFIERFRNFSQDSDFHGLKRCAHPRVSLSRRVVWILFVTACTTYFLNAMVNRVLYYLDSPHSTRVDLLYVAKLDFPAVTFCNVNQHRLSALSDTDLYHAGQMLGLFDTNWTLLHPTHYDDTFRSRVAAIDWPNFEPEYPFSFPEFTNRTGHQIRDSLLLCRWKNRECSAANFSHVFTVYGNCWTFNGGDRGPVLQSTKTGRGAGLSLYLNVEEYDYLNNDDATDAGLKLLPHDQGTPPMIDELGLGIQPGNHYFMSVRRGRITNLPTPYGDCAKDYKMKFFDKYSVGACRLECMAEEIIKNCSCRVVEHPKIDDSPICSIKKKLECALPMLDSLSENNSCVCHNPCNVSSFDIILSSLRIRHETVDKLRELHRHNLPDVENLDENIIAVDIFYESLNYETVEQYEAYPSGSLFGDIGGQIGLFVGASVLTIAHLMEFISEEIVRLIRHIREKKKKRKERVLDQKIIHELKEPEKLMNSYSKPRSNHHNVRPMYGRKYDPSLFGHFCRDEVLNANQCRAIPIADVASKFDSPRTYGGGGPLRKLDRHSSHSLVSNHSKNNGLTRDEQLRSTLV